MKKRRIRWGRILVLLALPVAMVIGIIFGIRIYQNIQQEQLLASIENVARPDSIGEETFSSIREKAKESADYQDIFFHLDDYDEEILTFLLADEDRLEFVKAYPDRDTYTRAAQLDGSVRQVPLLLQWDLDWGYTQYGGDYFYKTGCAPTCLSMVLSYLKQDVSITPYTMAQFSMDNDGFLAGVGTKWELLSLAAEEYDVSCVRIDVTSASMEQALSDGQVLICSMTPGDFTQYGHFIVVDGFEDGMYTVKDPNSIKNSQKQWDPDTLVSQIGAVWAFSA